MPKPWAELLSRMERRNQKPACSIWVLSPQNGCQLWFTWFKWFLNSFSWHTFMIFIHIRTFRVCVCWVWMCVRFHGCVYRNQRVCLVSLTFTVGDQTCSNLGPQTSACLPQWHNQDSHRYRDRVETFYQTRKGFRTKKKKYTQIQDPWPPAVHDEAMTHSTVLISIFIR